MSEIKVMKISAFDGSSVRFYGNQVEGAYYPYAPLLSQRLERLVNWPSIGSVSTAEARAFAAAIIAVADAVEKEGKG